jgi:hypothetical protein
VIDSLPRRPATMPWDIFLTILTLFVAVIGIRWKDPSPHIQALLITFAVLSSVGSIVKSFYDDADKKFLETAVISGLTPPNSAYTQMEKDIREELISEKSGLDDCGCIHDSDGMACFLASTSDQNKHGIVVFDRFGVAQLYAHNIQKSSNRTMIREELNKE